MLKKLHEQVIKGSPWPPHQFADKTQPYIGNKKRLRQIQIAAPLLVEISNKSSMSFKGIHVKRGTTSKPTSLSEGESCKVSRKFTKSIDKGC